jgi:FkbM family methyltransferase
MKPILNLAKKILPIPVKTSLKRLICAYEFEGFKPYIKKKHIEGELFDFWIGDPVGQKWYDINSIEPDWPEMRFIKDEMLVAGDVVLECGTHHGCTTILFSKWVGITGRVVAFEPFPRNCQIITKNIEINSLNNVSVEEKAVGFEKGKIRIDGVSNSSVIATQQGIEVEMTNLDEYQHLKPTFIKIDVEGFEQKVLEGAVNLLNSRPKLAIEIHTDVLGLYGASVEKIIETIDPARYNFWLQRDDRVYPVAYDTKAPITNRAHLFCLPK